MKKNLKKFFDYLKKHIKGINRSIRLIRKRVMIAEYSYSLICGGHI